MERFRHFALYGRSEVGKSTLLAALQILRIPHPEGWHGRVLPLQDIDEPKGDVDLWDRTDISGQLWRGHKAVEATASKIKDGALAYATALSDGLNRVNCQFTKDSKTFNIQLVDFAGELVEPGKLNDSESLEKTLQEQLKHHEAFFVLVDVPTESESEPSDDLVKLSDAFSALKSSRTQELDIPVVMIISKSDRDKTLREGSGDAKSVEDFLSRHKPFQTVRNALKGGTKEGLFHVFAVSALGEVDETPSSRKVQWTHDGLLKSFGLETPFIWAAEKCESEEEAARSRKAKWFSIVGAISILALALCWLIGEATWEDYAYEAAFQRRNDPKSSGSAEYEQWLSSYAQSTPLRHVLMKWVGGYSKDDARVELAAFRHEIVERHWKPVIGETDLLKRGDLATQFKATFPNTQFQTTAQSYIQNADIERRWQEFANIKTRLPAMLDRGDTAELAFEAREVEAMDASDSERLQSIKSEIVQRIQEEIQKIAMTQKRDTFLKTLDAALQQKKIVPAGSMLNDRLIKEPNREWIEPHIANFVDQFSELWTEQVAGLKRKNRWEECAELFRSFQREYIQWDDSLKNEAKIRNHVVASQQSFNEAYDKYLYKRLVDSQSLPDMETYLDKAPLGAMRLKVSLAKAWLERTSNKDTPREYQLELRAIQWSSKAQDSYHNFVHVHVGNKKIIDLSGIRSIPGTTRNPSNSPKTQLFKASKNDELRVAAKIIEDDVWYYGGGDDDHGEGEDMVTIDALLNGIDMKLNSEYGVQTMTIRGVDPDPMPKLEAWSNR